MHNIIEKLQELKQAQKEYRKEVAGRNNSKKVNRLKDKVYNLYLEIKEMNKDVEQKPDPTLN
jgi:hypothetical protein